MTHPEKNKNPESSNAPLQQEIFMRDHWHTLQNEVTKKIHYYKKEVGDYVGFPPDVKLATIQCLLELEQEFSLSDIAWSLRNITILLSEFLLLKKDINELDEVEQNATIYKMKMLHQIATAFDWIKVYGTSMGSEID